MYNISPFYNMSQARHSRSSIKAWKCIFWGLKPIILPNSIIKVFYCRITWSNILLFLEYLLQHLPIIIPSLIIIPAIHILDNRKVNALPIDRNWFSIFRKSQKKRGNVVWLVLWMDCEIKQRSCSLKIRALFNAIYTLCVIRSLLWKMIF